MANAAREHQMREQAFRDYCNLEVEGISPNPNALWEWYIQKNQAHPELRASIPTTNRTTVYTWAREDKWKERYSDLKLEQTDRVAEKYDAVRERAFSKMVSFQNEAIENLIEIIRESKDDVRLKAIDSLLDRTGMARRPAQLKGEAGEKPEAENDDDLVNEDMSEAKIKEWLVRNTANNMNA